MFQAYDCRRRTEDFEENEALLKGHFLLTSSLQRPLPAMRAGVATPGRRRTPGLRVGGQGEGGPDIAPVDLVIAPALGGVIVAHEVARALGVRALFTERQEKTMTLRRAFRSNRASVAWSSKTWSRPGARRAR